MGPKLALADEGRAGGAGQTIDQNSRETGAWQRAPAAVAAVRQERERPLSARETERFEATWTAIFTQMGRRSAPAEEFEVPVKLRRVLCDLALTRGELCERHFGIKGLRLLTGLLTEEREFGRPGAAKDAQPSSATTTPSQSSTGVSEPSGSTSQP